MNGKSTASNPPRESGPLAGSPDGRWLQESASGSGIVSKVINESGTAASPPPLMLPKGTYKGLLFLHHKQEEFYHVSL